MKTFNELIKEFHGTPLQRDERRKKLVGVEIQIVGELYKIAPDYIYLHNFEPEVHSRIVLVDVHHEGEQLRKQLLEYSHSDRVRLTARFTDVHFGEDSDSYKFDLISIVKLNPREAQEKRNKIREEKNESNCFVATAAYGVLNPSVFLLQEYRDRILNKAIVGRAAVRFYYLVSPPLARFIETSSRRRFIARVLLRPVVFVARRQLESARKREQLRA